MNSLHLGRDHATRQAVRLPKKSFDTHYHLIGGTGKGKTTAIHTILHALMLDPIESPCLIVWDRLGNLSFELLLWLTSDFCTDDVRDRLVYIEPSREDVVIGMNPLLYETEDHCFFRVSRATDIILRAWEDVNIEAMPRLARWTFNAFYAASQLGLTIADCAHFLMPGSAYHKQLMALLPPRLHFEWQEVLGNRSGEALRILDSSRNRLKPFFEWGILRRMFGSTENKLDVLRFMRDGKIVILNLAPQNRLSPQLADAIGALILNEVLSCARSLPPGIKYPAYLFLDEFQNFVGPDIEAAVPEVRQLQLRLILAHQSLAQLKRGQHDLTTMIFQAQSRMIFGVQGEDADLLGQELASLTYDPARVKEEIFSRRQLVTGHSIMELATWSRGRSTSENWQQQYGKNWSVKDTITRSPAALLPTRGQGHSQGETSNAGSGGGRSDSISEGGHQVLVPTMKEFLELSSRTYVNFEEHRHTWARDVRQLLRGQTFLRLVDNPKLFHVDVKKDTPGYLDFDLQQLHEEFPEVIEEVERLKEKNFSSELFSSPQVVEDQIEARLQQLLRPAITLQSGAQPARLSAPKETTRAAKETQKPADDNPFP